MLPSLFVRLSRRGETSRPDVIPRDFDHLLFLFSFDFATVCHKATLFTHFSLCLSLSTFTSSHKLLYMMSEYLEYAYRHQYSSLLAAPILIQLHWHVSPTHTLLARLIEQRYHVML
jgi:hypothetical protein